VALKRRPYATEQRCTVQILLVAWAQRSGSRRSADGGRRRSSAAEERCSRILPKRAGPCPVMRSSSSARSMTRSRLSIRYADNRRLIKATNKPEREQLNLRGCSCSVRIFRTGTAPSLLVSSRPNAMSEAAGPRSAITHHVASCQAHSSRNGER
jgi:hypothetical protein